MDTCTVNVQLKPRAKKNRCEIGNEDLLKISVTSPAVDNKANDHLIRFLADLLDMPKSALTIIKGTHARQKAIAINGLAHLSVMSILNKKAK